MLNGAVLLCSASNVMKRCAMYEHEASIMLVACLLSSELFHSFNIGEPVFKGKDGSFFCHCVHLVILFFASVHI